MKLIIVALAASAVLTGCVSGVGVPGPPAELCSSQAYQAPAIRNDTFGGAAMTMRGLPR